MNLRCLGQVSIAQEKVVAVQRNQRNLLRQPDERPLALRAGEILVLRNDKATNGVRHTTTPKRSGSGTPGQ